MLGRHAGSLRWLSLAGNGLEQLPEALTALPRLRYLDLSGNRLSALPQGFTNLQSLEVRFRLGWHSYAAKLRVQLGAGLQ